MIIVIPENPIGYSRPNLNLEYPECESRSLPLRHSFCTNKYGIVNLPVIVSRFRYIDRQTDRQAGRQTDRQTD